MYTYSKTNCDKSPVCPIKVDPFYDVEAHVGEIQMIIGKVHAERSRFDDLFADNSLHVAAIHVGHVNFTVLVAIFLVPVREIKIAVKNI